jgi:hypothetical protein
MPRYACPAIASGSSITFTIAGSPAARARSSAGRSFGPLDVLAVAAEASVSLS